MTLDARKAFDQWVRRSNLIPELRAAFLAPGDPPINNRVVTAFEVSCRGDKLLKHFSDDALRAEAYFRVDKVREAIHKYFETQLTDLAIYTLFASGKDRKRAIKMLKKFTKRLEEQSRRAKE